MGMDKKDEIDEDTEWIKKGMRDAQRRAIGKQLDKYIFDKSKIVKRKIFPFFTFKNSFDNKDIAAFGIYIYKDVEQYDKRGNALGTEQIRVPMAICSNGNMYEITDSWKKKYNIEFNELPDKDIYKSRWDLDSLSSYLLGDKNNIDGKEIYQTIEDIYRKYLYVDNEIMYTVHALWDIGTYFFLLFKYYPLMELRGMRGTAKTKIMGISRQITFNATEEMTNPTESTLFRLTEDNRPTKYIDEAEKIFQIVKGKMEPDSRAELINSGYKRGGSVPRQEKINNKFKTKYYSTYSPTMIASINGLYGATEDRAIVHITVKPSIADKRGNREISENAKECLDVRNDLYIFALQNWEVVKKAYDEFEEIEGLKNRDYWLWKGILTLAKLVCPDRLDELIEYVKGEVDMKKIEFVDEGSTEWYILKSAYHLLASGKSELYLKDFVNTFEGKWNIHQKSISRIMCNLGFATWKIRTKHGTAFRLDMNVFKIVISKCSSDLVTMLENTKPHYLIGGEANTHNYANLTHIYNNNNDNASFASSASSLPVKGKNIEDTREIAMKQNDGLVKQMKQINNENSQKVRNNDKVKQILEWVKQTQEHKIGNKAQMDIAVDPKILEKLLRDGDIFRAKDRYRITG